jgi:DoxX
LRGGDANELMIERFVSGENTIVLRVCGRVIHKLYATDDNTATVILRPVLGVVFFVHGAQKMLGWFGGFGFSGQVQSCFARGNKDSSPAPAPYRSYRKWNFPGTSVLFLSIDDSLGYKAVQKEGRQRSPEEQGLEVIVGSKFDAFALRNLNVDDCLGNSSSKSRDKGCHMERL